jgi:two-component system CheB/CheR fusion protein
MVCHELRNVLGPLLNAAELLNLPDTDIETWRWARQTLLRQAQHMKHLLTDMLDPQFPETGVFQLHAKILDLSQLVETICTNHTPVPSPRSHLTNPFVDSDSRGS